MEKEKKYTPLLVIEEASRCLLCYDAPCSKMCPAQTDPARFIRAVRFRNFKGAAEVVRENNALGGVCARICPTEKLCQSACSRCGIDKPIDIAMIQKYITDFESSSNMQVLKVLGDEKEKIAIVGSGPAGLQAAASLRVKGYYVDVYEAREHIGGWLRYGIPSERLSNAVLDKEISHIEALGVNFILKHKIDEKEFRRLQNDYDAILLATGMPEGRSLELFENDSRVVKAVDFLALNKFNDVKIDSNAVHLVIGGGDVAMDVITTLKNKGANNVICVARETASEFLASKKELSYARELNASILDGYTPISNENGLVRFKHSKLNSELSIKADYIYLAVGQKTSLDDFDVDKERGYIVANNYQTSIPKVFTAGDVTMSDKLAVYAVKQGKEAADAIDAYLKGGKKNA